MSEKRKRRHFTAEQKVAILKRHFVDKVPVSDLCEKYKLQPSVFYDWQHKLWSNAAVALEAGRPEPASTRRERALTDQVQTLEAKLIQKDSVIAEISAEYVALNKQNGVP
jgi:transposase